MTELAPILPQSRHLLPGNATPFERALAVSSERIDAIPAPLDTLWDPWRCPAEFLPWLAWALSVDIWKDDWPEGRKRYACAESFEMHALKGTLEGMRRHIAMAGGRLVHWRRPPNTCFAATSVTAEQRRAFLARFPQLRIYPFRDRSGETRLMPGARGWRFRFFAGGARAFARRSTAAERAGRNAYLYEPRDGSETKLRTFERQAVTETGTATTITAVGLRTTRGRRLFCGRALGKVFTHASSASRRVVQIVRETVTTLATETLTLRHVTPGLDPISVVPEHAAIRAPRGRRQFPGRPLRRFWHATDARFRLFDRYYLFDPDRGAAASGAKSFVGRARLGQPAYTGSLVIDIRRPRARRRFGKFVSGFLYGTDLTLANEVRRAAAISKSLRDTITVTTKTARPVRFGDRIRLSDGFTFGSWMRAY